MVLFLALPLTDREILGNRLLALCLGFPICNGEVMILAYLGKVLWGLQREQIYVLSTIIH